MCQSCLSVVSSVAQKFYCATESHRSCTVELSQDTCHSLGWFSRVYWGRGGNWARQRGRFGTRCGSPMMRVWSGLSHLVSPVNIWCPQLTHGFSFLSLKIDLPCLAFSSVYIQNYILFFSSSRPNLQQWGLMMRLLPIKEWVKLGRESLIEFEFPIKLEEE